MAKNKTKTNQQSELNEILSKMKEMSEECVKLYFITRILKDGMSKRSKSLDKYLYNIYQIDIDNEIRQYLYKLSIDDIERATEKDYTLVDYDPIIDDTEHLFTYKLKREISPFFDCVVSKLQQELPRVQSIESLMSEKEELWAYCTGFFRSEKHIGIYTFRKIMSSKIAIDEQHDDSKSLFSRHIRTLFDSSSKKLTLMKGESITLDKKIDCIYVEDTFFVLGKQQFEQIIGLQEEFRATAEEVVDQMIEIGMIEGLDSIKEELKTNTVLHKKLAKIKQLGSLGSLNKKYILKMKKVCQRYGEQLCISDSGNIVVKNKGDFDVVLKVLCDYYKRGEVSGKGYGTFSGRELKIKSEL